MSRSTEDGPSPTTTIATSSLQFQASILTGYDHSLRRLALHRWELHTSDGFRPWAAYPDPSIDGAKTNTTISVHLRFPFAANPATLPTALITSVLIGAAFLTLIVCVVVCQATE